MPGPAGKRRRSGPRSRYRPRRGRPGAGGPLARPYLRVGFPPLLLGAFHLQTCGEMRGRVRSGASAGPARPLPPPALTCLPLLPAGPADGGAARGVRGPRRGRRGRDASLQLLSVRGRHGPHSRRGAMAPPRLLRTARRKRKLRRDRKCLRDRKLLRDQSLREGRGVGRTTCAAWEEPRAAPAGAGGKGRKEGSAGRGARGWKER